MPSQDMASTSQDMASTGISLREMTFLNIPSREMSFPDIPFLEMPFQENRFPETKYHEILCREIAFHVAGSASFSPRSCALNQNGILPNGGMAQRKRRRHFFCFAKREKCVYPALNVLPLLFSLFHSTYIYPNQLKSWHLGNANAPNGWTIAIAGTP